MDAADSAGRSLGERPDAGEGSLRGRDWRGALAQFVAETDRVLDLLSGFMADVRGLDDNATLSFLHDTVSDRHHAVIARSEEHTSELQSLMRISYAVFCLKKKNSS